MRLMSSMVVTVHSLIFVPFVLVSVTVSCDVFKLTGSSVQFDILNQGPRFEELFWTFNESNTLMIYYEINNKTKLYSAYKDRVEFSEEFHTLVLKNLQKNDSGLYKATTTGEEQKDVAEYKLFVLDPVEDPVLIPVPQQPSNDTCNVTIICRGHDRSITSSCYNETCEEKEVTSQVDFALSLSVSAGYVICNHSNPVSWKNTSMELNQIKLFCCFEGNKTQANHSHLEWTMPVLGSVVVVIILVALFIVYERIRKKNKTGSLQFDTDETKVQDKDESPTAFRMLGKPVQPSTVYSTVQRSAQPPGSGKNCQNIPDPELNTGQRQACMERCGRLPIAIYSSVGCSKPETIYATVMKTRNPSHDT
ncbi:SLAM family member 5-like [Brachyhypopomus gauderio]|uniref:SLAM family member 5-like n=1 Tax=Brachyhypopomus gauderio TaxID=698409 RepID=UPI0040425E3A